MSDLKFKTFHPLYMPLVSSGLLKPDWNERRIFSVLNDFLKEWVVRMDELKSGVIPRDEYLSGKSTDRRPVMDVENMSIRRNGAL